MPGVDGEIRAAVEWDPDGPGPQPALLVVGGDFELAGDVPAEDVAAWDGLAWHSFGSAMNGAISALAVYNGELIAGGSFTTAGGKNASRIARWDGSAWQPLGSGMGPASYAQVISLCVYDGELIAGGQFAVAGGLGASNIARWNGSSWAALGSGVGTQPGNQVLAVTVYNGQLIAGGSFDAAGGVSTGNIARWDGSAWQDLGAGTNLDVQSLAIYNGELIAGGIFTTAGGTYASHIARWDGSAWGYLDGGIGNPPPFTAQVLALGVYNGQLFAGGAFGSAGNSNASNIAAWDGLTWEPLGSGTDNWVEGLAVFDGELVAVGNMMTAGFTGVSGAARWDGSTWRSLGSGTNGEVHRFATFEGALIAGGSFTSAGDVGAERMARWDGAAWQPLAGGGVNGPEYPAVTALAVDNGSLIVGGHFAAAGETPAENIARWDGVSWHTLGSGITGGAQLPFVAALAVYNGDLVAGGRFGIAGGVSAQNIARWDGSAWHPLGSGIGGAPGNTHVLALAVYDGKLIAGGDFTTVDGKVSAHLARFGALCAPGDLDEDGDVDLDDLIGLLDGWGPCPAPCPPSFAGDIDGDCQVGVVDFLTLLSNWK